MVGIEKINPVYPGWRVNPTDEKQQQKKRQDEDKDKQRNPDNKDIEDGEPHIDEYA
jgi:hypothetical protein